MTPTYLSYSQPSPYPLEYYHEDDDHHHHELSLISPKSQVSSSSSSSSSPSPSCPIMFSNPSLDQGGYHHHGHIQLLGHPHEADTFVSHDGSYDHTILKSESDQYGLKLPIWKTRDSTKNEDQSCDNNNYDNGSAKWMSSKMRLMQKMMNQNGTDRSGADVQTNNTPIFGGDHNKQLLETDHNSNNNNTIRVCSDCNTTKTPLWRSGPRGPKSLCNACGIRQRKARRAMAAANGTILATATKSHVKTKVQQHKEKKKRSKKLAAATSSTAGRSEKLCFEDFTLSLSEKYSAFQRVFPQDEKEEAAILLMALSYGLVS